MSEDTHDLLKLEPDDVRLLLRLIRIMKRIEGWCAVNRWIGKTLLYGALTLLVLLSGAVEAIQKLIGLRH